MIFLKHLSDFFNIIEPWIVFFTFLFQISIFFMLMKGQIKRQKLSNDIINTGLEKLLKWTEQKTIPVKEKDALKDKSSK